MSSQKPLPALPALTLSLNAKQHRTHLIRNFILSETTHDDPATVVESKRDGWVYALEEALDEFGKCIAQGNWLEGIRELRETCSCEKLKVEQEKRRDKAKKRKNQEESGESTSSSMELPPLPSSLPAAGKRLFLCVAPPDSRVPLPFEDSGFDIVPSNIGCSFKAGEYAVHDSDVPTVLYGNNDGHTVGGTFVFKGVTSPQQHEQLFRVLRLAVYVHLSLVLEQHLLVDSNIALLFPRPRLAPSYPSHPHPSPPPSGDQKGKKYISSSFIPSGLRNFFPFKPNSTNKPRSTTIMPLSRETKSPKPTPTPFPSTRSPRASFDFSAGLTNLNTFRFSILGTSTSRSPIPEPPPPDPRPPFTQMVSKLHAGAALLSTTPGVRFEPPALVVDLAEREKLHHGARRLRGDERAGLTSVLGWEGKEHLARHMTGTLGFVKHQSIEVLETHHVPGVHHNSEDVVDPRKTTICGRAAWKTFRYYAFESGEDATLGGMVRWFLEVVQRPCEVRGCKLVRGVHETRFVHGGVKVTVRVEEEQQQASSSPPEPEAGKIEMWESCASCEAKSERREMSHGTYLLSFGKFLELLIYSETYGVPSPAICPHLARMDVRRHFGSPTHAQTVTFACSRVEDIFELRVPRLQISCRAERERERERGAHESGSTITQAGSGETETGGEESLRPGDEREEERRELRREIRAWWEGVADHLDKLEAIFTSHDLDDAAQPRYNSKALPRLPSTDDQYEHEYEYDGADRGSSVRSATPSTDISGLPATAPSTPRRPSTATTQSSVSSVSSADTATPTPTPPRAPAPPPSPAVQPPPPSGSGSGEDRVTVNDPPPLERLSTLRQTFHRTEQALYAQLARTNGGTLNEARRAFVTAARGAERRMRAWEGKHCLGSGHGYGYGSGEGTVGRDRGDKEGREGEGNGKWAGSEEPEWWRPGCHALPGSSVIVREDDWGSVIAFTLSTTDYQRELTHIAGPRQPSSASATPRPRPTPLPPDMTSPTLSNQSNQSTTSSTASSSFFSSAMTYKLFAPSDSESANPQPDPDADDASWRAPADPDAELFSAVISRKEHPHPRDAPSLLSIREVLRTQQKSPAPAPLPTHAGLGPDSAAAAASGSASRFGGLGAPPSAWAKPDVGISRDEADGVVSAGAPEGADGAAAERLLAEFECTAGVGVGVGVGASRPMSRASGQCSAPQVPVPLHPPSLLRKCSKLSLAHSVESDATAVGVSKESLGARGTSVLLETSTISTTQGVQDTAKLEVTAPPPVPPKDERPAPRVDSERMREVSGTTVTTGSSFVSTLTHGFMRLMLPNGTGSAMSDTSRAASPFAKAHHGLLSLDAAGIDERPHIKYDWTIGKRLKFSCTVYYARQFDLLRRRCGVDGGAFVQSLRRSANWAADGGKSRSNFWKTGDDRFVIKTLVDAWNVADLQVLIDLAPSYFRYMDATANKATVLAKMMGFYTIEIRNLETGNVQSKADLLVMENLFYNQRIAKAFDLKGIQGRKVKPSGIKMKTKTLFDGEWIEGQQKTLMLLRPHSKQVLHMAIRSDADFLARSNIMDYSLLVGVDEERKQIACGLVDTIGSYTFAKTLEYKAKHGLNSGKEITVIPPAEYQDRFVSALEGYFVACPDKWSKPVDESKIVSDVNLLPSVL
ncbi:hypothetical protein H0H92_010818 [Tricholoma furcatifolium]|nr:hypothetical protein H0H92_010818 [Tricholoma furcatifolium]